MTHGASLPNNESGAFQFCILGFLRGAKTLELLLPGLMFLQKCNALKESKEQCVIKSIDDRLEEMPEFSKKCKNEAKNASDRKRNNRSYQVFIGVGTAALGFIGTVFSDQPIVVKIVSPLTIATGSVVASISEYIDPKKSRQRAIDLKNIAVDIDNLAEKKKLEYLGLTDDPTTNLDKLVDLDNTLRDEFTNLQKEAWDNGVDV